MTTLLDRFNAVRGSFSVKALALLCNVATFRLREWLAYPRGASAKASARIEAWITEQERLRR